MYRGYLDMGNNNISGVGTLNVNGGSITTLPGDIAGNINVINQNVLSSNESGSKITLAVGGSGAYGGAVFGGIKQGLYGFLSFETNSGSGSMTERMRILGNNGNVGINTTTPTEKLDVNGNAVIRGYLNFPSGGAAGIILNNHPIDMGNGPIYNAGELYNNNTDLYLTGAGRNIILQTTSGGAIHLNASSNITITNGGAGCTTNFTGGDVYFSGGVIRIPGSATQIDMWNYCSINQNSGDMSLDTQGNLSLNARSAGKSVTLNTSTINVNGKLDMHTNDISNLSYVSGSNIVIQDLGGNLDLLSYRVALPSGFLDLPATDSKIDFNGYCYISRDYGTSNFNIKASKNLSILTSSVTRNLGATEVVQPVIQYGTATGSGASGSVTVALPTPFTSATSYIATASMMDTTAAKMSVNRNNLSSITIYWDQAGAGSQSIGWTCMGN